MTASVTTLAATRVVAIPSERPAREPALELERAARFALGCDGLVRPEKVEWSAEQAALLVTYPVWGDSTFAELAAAEPADAARIGTWLTTLATTLATLHDLGVAHGHLRAELIAVSGAELRVLGYGVEAVARAVGGARLAAAALPEQYRAPEQRGETPAAASPWTDAFAFGVLAAELIPPALRDARLSELLALAASESLARRPSDLVGFARELDEALRERAAQPPAQVAVPELEQAAPEPEPEPEPAPTEAPKPVAAPPPLPLPPVSQRGRSSGAWILAMVAGAVLMVVGVAALFVVAVVRSPGSSSAPAVTVAAADAGAPYFPLPPVVDAALPSQSDASSTTPEPVEVPELSSADLGNASGVSVSDATAALPLDDQAPVWGAADAPATLVVFGDLECQHTRRSIGVLLSLKKALGDELRIAWRHRPLSANSLAREAAELAAALHAEHGSGVFWRFLAEVAKAGESPTEERVGRWIESAGGDRSRVLGARQKHAARVDRDLELAGRFDVRATPTLFLNGIRIEGFQGLSELRRQTQQEIVVARVALASGIESSTLYATRVRKNLIGLGPDVTLRSCPEIGKSPTRGGASPLVTIVEFSDFECPYCKRVQPTLERVLSRFGGDVRLAWKNLPLASHSRARPAAAIALEAHKHGGASGFWRAHDLLFAGASGLDDESLKQVATKAGLDPTQALQVVRRGDHDPSIDADVRLAKKVGAGGTPTFFVNGRKLEGAVPFDRFSAIVQQELDAARRLVDSGTPRARVYETLCGAP